MKISKLKFRNEIMIAVILVALLIAGGSFAWFHGRYTTVTEQITFGVIDFEITRNGNFEIETTNDNNAIGKTEVRLLPGRNTDLAISMTNISSFDSLLRYKIEVTTPNFFQTGDNFGTIFSYDNDIKFGNVASLNDGFIYYQGIIPPNGQTIDLIKNFGVQRTVSNFYNNKRVDIRITIEAIQASPAAAELVWNVPPTNFNTIFGTP